MKKMQTTGYCQNFKPVYSGTTQREVELSCVVEVFIATLRRNSTRHRVELSWVVPL